MIRVGPSSWRWCGKSARGTLLVSPEPIGLAALLYSKNCASFVHRSMVVSSRVVVDVVTSPLSSQTRRRRTDGRCVPVRVAAPPELALSNSQPFHGNQSQ
jgi:hypothetical protein